MNLDIKLSGVAIKSAIKSFLRRFHVIIFFLIITGGITLFVFLLNDVLAKAANTSGYVSPNSKTTFDQVTIDRINKLGDTSYDDNFIKTRQDAKLRINPFIE